MSKIDDLINGMPEALQDIAWRYLLLWKGATLEDVGQWIGMISDANWTVAYEYAISRMTTAENIKEQEYLNSIVAGLNMENAELVDAQRQVVQQMLLAAMSFVISALDD
jgi:hypothetical protein